MTIDQRVEAYLAKSVDYQMAAEGIKHMARQSLKSLLLEVARDQRQECAEAVLDLGGDANFKVDRDRAQQAIMNAKLEAK